MAIDNARRRFSMIGFGSPVPVMCFVPDGLVDATARADLLFFYLGLATYTGDPSTRLTFTAENTRPAFTAEI